jgi:hypothetical protein
MPYLIDLEPNPPEFVRDKQFSMIVKKVCACCKNPIEVNIYIHMDSMIFFTHTYSFYSNAKSIPSMHLNRRSWHKGKVMCLACATNGRSSTPRDLLRRECGLKRKVRHLTSLTTREIYEWFKDYESFYTRRDLAEIVVPYDYMYIPQPINFKVFI